MPNGSCSPPGPRSPTACSSPANGTSGRSSPGTRPTTTDGAPTAAGSSARPALTIPLADLSGERIKRRRVLGGLINEYERVALEDQVNAGGQVLEPHRLPDQLAGLARSVTGPIAEVADRSWPRNSSAVWEITDPAGTRWFVKR